MSSRTSRAASRSPRRPGRSPPCHGATTPLAVAHQLLGDLDAAYAARMEGAQGRAAGRLHRQHPLVPGAPDHQVPPRRLARSGAERRGVPLRGRRGSPHYDAWRVRPSAPRCALARVSEAGTADADVRSPPVEHRRPARRALRRTACAARVALRPGTGTAPSTRARDHRRPQPSRGHPVRLHNLPIFASAARRLGLVPELQDAIAERGRPLDEAYTSTVRVTS